MSKNFAWLTCILIAFGAAGCPRAADDSTKDNANDPATENTAIENTATEDTVTDDTASDGENNETTADKSNAGSAPSTNRPQLCEIIPMADVAGITGGQYDSTNSQADYATITHCEYRGADTAHVVSLLFARGNTAASRWEAAQLFKPRPLEEFLDKACWEPVQGKLSATSDDRFVEVGVSKSHEPDEAERIRLAKKLAELLLHRM